VRTVLLIVHIAAAGTWLGANFVQATGQRMMTSGGPQAMAAWYRFTGRLAGPLYIPAGVLLVITGVWMVLTIDAYTFSDTFVIIGLGVLVVGAVLGSVVFSPTSEAAARAVEAGDDSSLRSTTGKLAAFGLLDTLLILLAITVMVLRLGA
jgi:hypothetical protein